MNTKFFLFASFLFVTAGLGIGLILFGQQPGLKPAGQTSILGSSQECSHFCPARIDASKVQTQAQTQQTDKAPADTSGREQARVKRTVDGDTLDVLIDGREEKVRLLGINTPESVDPRRAVECYGKEASHQMDLLATNHQVTMAGDSTNQDRDKYHRLLRYVYLEDGTFVNEWMVEKGYAFAYTSFPFKFMKHFVDLERQARSLELGLWNSTVCPYYKIK